VLFLPQHALTYFKIIAFFSTIVTLFVDVEEYV